jgi:glycosyltransferase involved in cell wall biosynthesis
MPISRTSDNHFRLSGATSAEPTFTRRVSVVIPAKNEANNLPTVLRSMPRNVFEVILVDGRSVDDTIGAARREWPGVRIVQQARAGKGNALAAGFAACRGDYIVMIDADGSMDPGEIPAFVTALDGGADYAKGSRFVTGGGSDDITRLRRAGNWGLNFMTNVLYGTRFTDLCYGYNAFRRECVDHFALPDHADTSATSRWGDGFEIETLINTRVAKADLQIEEVPSFEYDRISGQSNLQTFRDGFRVLRTILRERSVRRVPKQTRARVSEVVPVVAEVPEVPPVPGVAAY